MRGLGLFGKKKQQLDVDLTGTPWQLTLQHKESLRLAYIHYATHEEAKDMEDKTIALGWVSQGILWQIEPEPIRVH